MFTCATRWADASVITNPVYTGGTTEAPVADAVVDVGHAFLSRPACNSRQHSIYANSVFAFYILLILLFWWGGGVVRLAGFVVVVVVVVVVLVVVVCFCFLVCFFACLFVCLFEQDCLDFLLSVYATPQLSFMCFVFVCCFVCFAFFLFVLNAGAVSWLSFVC